MADLRERPFRLEPSLTRDYVNRAVKLAEIKRQMAQQDRWRRWADRLGWAIVVGLFGLAALVWWLQ